MDWKTDPQEIDNYITKSDEPDEQLSMTYQDYLNTWIEQFGEETSAEYGYYLYGKHTPCTVNRLSLEQFTSHLAALEAGQRKFNEAKETNDQDGMAKALADRFPHEIALLI